MIKEAADRFPEELRRVEGGDCFFFPKEYNNRKNTICNILMKMRT